MQKKHFFTLLWVVFFVGSAFSQDKKFSLYATAGPTTKLLDTGIGFHVGAQPYYAIWQYVGIEGLVNYSYTKIKGTFISGKTGKETNVNLLLGGRVYFVPPEKKNRVFINLLFGQSYTRATINGTAKTPSWEAAGSAGLYFQPSHFLIGIGAESQGYFFLRFGVNIYGHNTPN